MRLSSSAKLDKSFRSVLSMSVGLSFFQDRLLGGFRQPLYWRSEHQRVLHIWWPASIMPGTGISLSSKSYGSSCRRRAPIIAFCRCRQCRTVYSRSCLGATYRHGALRCSKYQPGASSGPQVLTVLTHLACSEYCPRTRQAVAGHAAWGWGTINTSGRLTVSSSVVTVSP